MQLNNLNGKTIIFDKAEIRQNRFKGFISEFGGEKCTSKKEHFAIIFEAKETTKTLLEIAESNECFLQKSFEKLESEGGEKFANYEVSNDIQNWTIETGSTGANTLKRVYVPDLVLAKYINSGNDLDLLFTKMKPLLAFKQVLENGSMQYLEEIISADKITLEKYKEEGVLIETKL